MALPDEILRHSFHHGPAAALGAVVGGYLGSAEGECSETTFEYTLDETPQVAATCHNHLGFPFSPGPHTEEFSIALCAVIGAVVFAAAWHLVQEAREKRD